MRRTKYYDIRLADGTVRQFYNCREAAEWMEHVELSKSVPAARVGLSSVLTGKRKRYRGFTVEAKRYY